MMKHMLLACLALVWAWQPAVAQEAPPDTTGILQTILLPRVSETLRERGVPIEEIEAAVMGAREQGVPAGETTDALQETAGAVEETGPIENFGAFVQEQLRSGLRGRELAEAIHAEHRRRGIGKGKKLESRQGPPAEAGQQGRGQSQGQAGRDTSARGGPPGVPGAEAAERGRGQAQGRAGGDTTGRSGPPAGRGQRGERPDSVVQPPDSGPPPDTGGNGGDR